MNLCWQLWDTIFLYLITTVLYLDTTVSELDTFLRSYRTINYVFYIKNTQLGWLACTFVSLAIKLEWCLPHSYFRLLRGKKKK